MKTRINTLRPEMLHKLVGENPSIFISDDFAFFKNMYGIVTKQMLEMVRTPQYVEIGRLVRVSFSHQPCSFLTEKQRHSSYS
ncbi:MAG: hypothetical protein J6P95_05820 [Paludibacteraceae bacterium]|nr:hypothetical protein [Paludibacteraceae bacterium]